MTAEELKKVEDIVNEQISKGLDVIVKNMPIEEAKKTGAQALFGEKYGDIVRVVNMSDFSIEFCGGTHVKNTSEIMAFKIISETGVAAGCPPYRSPDFRRTDEVLCADRRDIKECSASCESNSGESGRQDHPSDGRE